MISRRTIKRAVRKRTTNIRQASWPGRIFLLLLVIVILYAIFR